MSACVERVCVACCVFVLSVVRNKISLYEKTTLLIRARAMNSGQVFDAGRGGGGEDGAVQDDVYEDAYGDEEEQEEQEALAEVDASFSGGRGHTKEKRRGRGRGAAEPSAFMRRVLNDVKHEANPNMLAVLFENQLEIARGLRCVVRLPRRPLSPTRWGLLCPSMAAVDRANEAKAAQSSDPFIYFDGFDMYATELEARDTRFSDPLITRPNPVFDSALVENTFVDRKVFSTRREARGENVHGGAIEEGEAEEEVEEGEEAEDEGEFEEGVEEGEVEE